MLRDCVNDSTSVTDKHAKARRLKTKDARSESLFSFSTRRTGDDSLLGQGKRLTNRRTANSANLGGGPAYSLPVAYVLG